MELILDKNKKKEHLYLEVFHYYRELIMEKKLPPGSRMPSLRKCSQELKLSRTTIENAYLQLAAEGYIISKAQSGYYVTDIADRQHTSVRKTEKHAQTPCRFDFASSGVDRESFRFDLWRRYIKSALRQDERLLSYGEPQGEADLRDTLADYVRERRNVLCSGEDIVIGAGIQSLLHILCPLLEQRQTVSFPNPSFVQGSTVFHDYGFQVDYRNKDCDIIYVSPAHMTKWGDIMPVSRRLELVNYSAAHGSLVIEDDFENEFVYLQKPTPSLFGLAGGQNVVYLGTFSRLLLPSIRISFMVLPPELSVLYRKKADQYNQTALRSAVREVFGKDAQIQTGAAGTSLALTLSTTLTWQELQKKAQTNGLRLQLLREAPGKITLILSCSSMPVADFVPACKLLKDISQIQN